MDSAPQSKLIKIATQQFATKGFAAVSVRELTVASQINVSAISYYFNGKEGLYRAVLEEQLSPMLQALESAQNMASLSPIERLTSFSDQIARIHAEQPFLARLMSSEVTNPTDHGGPLLEKYFSQLFRFVHTALEEGIANGDFQANLDVTYATFSLVGMLNFYFVTKPIMQKFVSLTEQANTEYIIHSFQIYLNGIRNPEKTC